MEQIHASAGQNPRSEGTNPTADTQPRLQHPAFHAPYALSSASRTFVPLNHPNLPPFRNIEDINAASSGYSSSSEPDVYQTPMPPVAFSTQRHLTPISIQRPKRPVRTRRKGPSCDVCRKRKTKCDATNTAGCSECSQLNVPCQFTESTNRRINELERRLEETQGRLDHLRSSEEMSDSHPPSRANASQDLPASSSDISSREPLLEPQTLHDLGVTQIHTFDVRKSLQSTEVWIQQSTQPLENPPPSELPPITVAEELLELYDQCIQRQFPVMDWSRLRQDINLLYRSDVSIDLPRASVALIFAVLACGAQRHRVLMHTDTGQKFLSLATSLINLWEEHASITHVLVIFLASMFLAEANQISTSWIWLGSAIRIAQSLEMHVANNSRGGEEGETWRRIWWSLYVWDRLVATEAGKPILIKDEDCDVPFPNLDESATATPDGFAFGTSALLTSFIPIVRLLPPLSSLLKSQSVLYEPLRDFDWHLRAGMQAFPPQLRLSSKEPLDPLTIAPLICFQNTRLNLHRHNISPPGPTEYRSLAIKQCVSIARDTAGIISRCNLSPYGAFDTRERFLTAASTFLCLHLWRCMLFLILGQQYDAFFTIFQVSALIGESKAANVECGQNLRSFLQQLHHRFKQDAKIDIEKDEDVMRYLSGDLSKITKSWIMDSTETGAASDNLSDQLPHLQAKDPQISLTWSSIECLLRDLRQLRDPSPQF